MVNGIKRLLKINKKNGIYRTIVHISIYHLSVISNNVVEVECKGLKPDCDSESTLLSHKNL